MRQIPIYVKLESNEHWRRYFDFDFYVHTLYGISYENDYDIVVNISLNNSSTKCCIYVAYAKPHGDIYIVAKIAQTIWVYFNYLRWILDLY